MLLKFGNSIIKKKKVQQITIHLLLKFQIWKKKMLKKKYVNIQFMVALKNTIKNIYNVNKKFI